MSTFSWYECKISYDKIIENEKSQSVKEAYLVNAISFSEAENRIIEERTPFMSGEFKVTDIKITSYSEIFEAQDAAADRYFKVKLLFITLDEKSGKEKKTSSSILVQAVNLEGAVAGVKEGMKSSMMDYQIAQVSETAIMDVYHFSKD